MTTPLTIQYTPPPTIKEFIKDHRKGELFYDWIVGPVGSGKTTGLFFKLAYMAKLQEPGRDGIRRSRAVVVRNTMPQLRDTTLTSWDYWFKDGQAGDWVSRDNKFILKFSDVECEVLFRPLDTPDDVARVLSLEVTFAIIDEFVQIPKEIIDALSARLGRYPARNDGGATNWGMWGSSNPDTEDNWWYEFLHTSANVERVGHPSMLGADRAQWNARYFHQPSGLGDTAENLDNLPGGRDYYVNQIKGKTTAWIKQFVDAEWGYSASGKPVVAMFRPALHLAPKPLLYQRNLPLIAGMDPGLKGSALVFGQQDHRGRLLVLGELIQSGYGASRLINERIKPYMRNRFPDAQLIIAPDPASANRAQTDEKSVVDEFRKHYEVRYETNNRLPLRLNAIDHFTSVLTDVGPALLVDERECPTLVRALKGGWKFEISKKDDGLKHAEPADNPYSHPGDAFGYLCRYFHRQTERELRYSPAAGGRRPFVPPRSFGPSYHAR
jgi:hypothetical protein